MYYFVYHIDIIPLSWQEKQTFNHTWMKKIGSIFPSKKLLSVLEIRLKIKKCIESLQKQTMEVTFNLQNSKSLTFSLPTKENCTGTQHDGPVANIFALSYKKCHCNFHFFFSRFDFLPFWEILNITVCKQNKYFSVLAATIPKNVYKQS